WGLAITAGIGLLSLFAFNSAEAEQEQAQLKQSAKGVADVLREQNFQINENVRAALLKQAADEGILTAARDAGVTTQELTDALEVVNRKFDVYIGKHQQVGTVSTPTGQSVKRTTGALDEQGTAAQGAKDKLNGLSGANQQAAQTEREKEDAIREATGATEAEA